MIKPNGTAKKQLIKLIEKLNESDEKLNEIDFIAVLEASKNICANEFLIKNLVTCLNNLNDNSVVNKNILTAREKDVLEHIGKGLQSSSIANALNLSKSTIETHRKNIRKKLKLDSNDNLFSYAFTYSLIA